MNDDTEPTDDACPFNWTDALGDHDCHRERGHSGKHVCLCDATTGRT